MEKHTRSPPGGLHTCCMRKVRRSRSRVNDTHRRCLNAMSRRSRIVSHVKPGFGYQTMTALSAHNAKRVSPASTYAIGRSSTTTREDPIAVDTSDGFAATRTFTSVHGRTMACRRSHNCAMLRTVASRREALPCRTTGGERRKFAARRQCTVLEHPSHRITASSLAVPQRPHRSARSARC